MRNVYSHCVDLRAWAREEILNGNRSKAARIFKVAERWLIRKYGIDSYEYQGLYGYNNLK
jgi:hypothetical protein